MWDRREDESARVPIGGHGSAGRFVVVSPR